MVAIRDGRLITLDGDITTWSPLDGVPAPEYIPASWDGPHVGKRIIEGLRILARLPMARAVAQFFNSWPGFEIEYSERAQYADDPVWKAERAAERNYARDLPSSHEIAHMERTISWPAHYLADVPQLLITVSVVALMRSRDLDIDFAARRRLHLPPWVVRRWNRDGLEFIAHGLVLDAAPIF